MPAVCVMLVLSDREEIFCGLVEGLQFKEIALRLGWDPSVVSREVGRHGGRGGYRAADAQVAVCSARVRLKVFAVQRWPRLRAVVCRQLRGGWSPASIAGRLATDYPEDKACWVSHEAIYQWVYAQPVATLAREQVQPADRAQGSSGWAPGAAGAADPRAPLHRRTPRRSAGPKGAWALGRGSRDRQGG